MPKNGASLRELTEECLSRAGGGAGAAELTEATAFRVEVVALTIDEMVRIRDSISEHAAAKIRSALVAANVLASSAGAVSLSAEMVPIAAMLVEEGGECRSHYRSVHPCTIARGMFARAYHGMAMADVSYIPAVCPTCSVTGTESAVFASIARWMPEIRSTAFVLRMHALMPGGSPSASMGLSFWICPSASPPTNSRYLSHLPHPHTSVAVLES